jgi:magnesium transporter
MKSLGIASGEELRSMPPLERSRRRLAWLTINIALNLLGASVIAAYQDTLQAAIALAVFLPIISDMSGNSGNQAVAVSLRELSLGWCGRASSATCWPRRSGSGS